MKKLTMMVCALLLFTGNAQEKFGNITLPEGKNLFPNPDLQEWSSRPGEIQDWSNYGGKSIKLSWVEENGQKILRANSNTPGYHLGIIRRQPLKPATEYLYYIVLRGKIAPDSKIIPLYREGKVASSEKTFFPGSPAAKTTDFPWTLIHSKFKTPDVFPNGTGTFYPVLFYGTVELDIAKVGLIEFGSADKVLPKCSAEFKNILNNPSFEKGLDSWPYDWNPDFDEMKGSFRYEQDASGKGVMILLPPQPGISNHYNSVVLVQHNIRLNPGKKYRIGAWIQTKNLDASRSGLIIYNLAWTNAVGVQPLPSDTNGWKRVEADVILPPSRFEMYNFAVYTADCKTGEVRVRDPYLIPVDAEAAKEIKSASSIAKLYRITPIAPLLSKINVDKPEMTFSFRYILPKKEDRYECRIQTRTGTAQTYSAPRSFPLKHSLIKTSLGKLPVGNGMLKAEIVDKDTGSVLASEEYKITVAAPVKLSYQPEKRLNMLTSRLLTAPVKDTEYRFSNPREGWVFINLSKGNAQTKAFLNQDVTPVIGDGYGTDNAYETIRHLPAGDHTLKLSGSSGGELIINAIPEIFVYSYPHNPYYSKSRIPETFHPAFSSKYLFPNMTTFNHGYPIARLQKGAYEKTIRQGKKWFTIGLHKYSPNRYEDPQTMAARFRSALENNHNIHGLAFDEIAMASIEDKWVYTQALRHLTDTSKPIYTWSSGVKFMLNSMNTDYFSFTANNAGGRGKFLFECYARTQPTEKEGEIYLDDYLNESLRRAEKLMPDAARHSLIILGGYTQLGQYCTDTFAGPDVKAFWGRFFHKLATEKEFRDLHGVGLYCYNNANEESIRWATRLIRHYVIEGNTENLAEKYGYKYLPKHLTNGDFTSALAGWTAQQAEPQSIRAESIKNFGRNIQKRQWVPFSTGDTVCIFKRSAKAPNRLSREIVGLTPGKLYVLRYAVVDQADVNAKKASGKKLVLKASLKDAEDLTANSTMANYVGKDGVSVVNYVNNAAVVFKALKPTVTVTFRDWESDSVPGAAVGQELLLNFVRVNPYYADL